MARNDGIDRTVARNVNLTASKIANAHATMSGKRNPMSTLILYRSACPAMFISRYQLEVTRKCLNR